MCFYEFISTFNCPKYTTDRLIDWSKTTFINNVLLQGDKMYLQALNDGFVVLEPGVEFLSVDNLPKLVSVSSCIQTCFLQDM